MDEKEKLYNALVERNLYSKSFEEFDSQFSSPEKIQGLHSSLKERNLVSISPDSFQTKYFGDLGETEPSETTQTTDQETVNTKPSIAVEEPVQSTEEPRESSDGIAPITFGNSGFSGLARQGGEAINTIFRSGLSGAGQIIESFGTSADQARRKVGDIGPRLQIGEGEQAEQSILIGLGQKMQEIAQEMFPDDPEIQNNFINNTVPQALGSTMSFVAAGALGGAPAAAISGGLQLGQQAFTEAKQAGADDDTAMNSFLLNMPLGGLEAIPVSRLFSRLNKATGGSVANVLKEGTIGGIEEAVQESTQQYLSNVVARNMYDESRELLNGMGEGGAAGFAVGFMLNAMGASARNIRNNPNATQEEIKAAEKTEALVEEKRQALQETSDRQQSEPQGQQAELEFQESISVTGGQSSDTQSAEEITITEERQSALEEVPRSPTEPDAGTGRERGAFTTQKEKGGLSEDFKQEFQEKGERLYDPVADKTTKQIAEDFVNQNGVEGAKVKVFDEQADLTMSQRVAVGQNVLQKLDDQYNKLKGENEAKAEVKLDEQIDFANRIYKFGTELGRAVRAFSYYSAFSTDAWTKMYERQVQEANQGKSEPVAQVSEDIKTEIQKRAKKIKEKPEGFQREEAALDLMNYISRQTPVSKTDLGISFAYANILSGHTTQIVNFTSTLANTLLETGTMVSTNPSLAPDAFMGLYRGFGKGWREAKNVVKTGKITGSRRTSKLDDIPDTLEQVQFKGAFKPLNAWKYVRRVMAANDIIFFKAAEESRARMLAKSIAKKEGGSEQQIRARTEQIIGTDQNLIQQAEQQARDEGFTPDRKEALEIAREEGLSGREASSRAKKITNDYRRRVDEIAEQRRSDEIRDEAKEFGLRATFNNKPTGLLGATAQSINSLSSRYPIVKMVVPFTNIISNVGNRMIDYTPGGYLKLRQWSAKSDNPDFMSDDWKQQASKAFLGTLGMTTMALINAMSMDEDDPFLEFTGRGPDSFRDRFQLQESGWKPYSLKVGDTYISYKETPIAAAASLVANYTDAMKYEDLSEESAAKRVAYTINAAPQMVMEQSFLTGLQELFTSLSQENIVKDDNIFGSAISKGRAIAIPNAIKQIDRIFDPTVYTDFDIEEALIRDIPVARSKKGRPIINVLGEPIRNDFTFTESALHRFMSVQKSDPVWRAITEKQAFISHPTPGQIKIDSRQGRRSMTPEEHYTYLRDSGQLIKRTLRANLGRIKAMDEASAQDFVKKVTRNHRGQVKERIQQQIRRGKTFD